MEPIAPPLWEDLPAGVLEIVFSKIDSQEELGPFRLVNSSWRNALDGSLKSLTIQKTHYGVDIESLGRTFTRLEKLSIRSKDEDILHKLGSIKSLTQLQVIWGPCDRHVRCNGFELLTNLSALEIYSLSNDFEPNFIKMLYTLPTLKCLSILRMHLLGKDMSSEQQAIEGLPGMTNLTWLNLYNFGFTSMEFLSGLTNLEVLSLDCLGEGKNLNMSPLSSLVKLTRLDLSGYEIGSSVANLKNLTRLDLTNNVLKNGDLATLTGLSKLTHLDLSGNEVNDEGVRFLTGLVSLKKLLLNGTGVKTAIQILAPMTGLEVLDLDETPTKGTDLVGLSNLVGLKEVSVGDHEIGRGELERVSAALPHIKFEIWSG